MHARQNALTLVCGMMMAGTLATGAHGAGAVNLLTNADFMAAGAAPGSFAGWEIQPAEGWSRGEIVAFQGLPWNLGYILRKGGSSRIAQKSIPVESNTWYVLHAWYLGTIRPGADGRAFFYLYAAPDDNRPDLAARYGLVGRGSDPVQPSDAVLPPYGGVLQGSCGEWVQVRAFAWSGASRNLHFFAGFEGAGDVHIGNCEMRKAVDDDFRAVNVLDGAFEGGVVGCAPLSFVGKPGYPPPIVHEKGPDYRLGSKKSAGVFRKKGEKTYLYGPQSIPVFGGQRVRVTFWARSSWRTPECGKDPMVLTSYILRQRDWWRKSESAELKFDWDRVTQEITLPAAGEDLYKPGPQLLDFHIEVTGPALSLYLDDYTIEVLPPAKAEPPKPRGWQPAGKNLIMNASFEAGQQGWGVGFTGNNPTSGGLSVGKACIDREIAHNGQCSLRIELADISPARNSTALGSAYFPIEPETEYTVSFWAKADKPVALALGLYWHTIAMPDDKFNLTTEWRRFSRTFKVIRLRDDFEKRLSLEFHSDQPATYWLDTVQIERGANATEFEPGEKVEIGADCTRLYPYYRIGERPEADLYLASHLPEKEKFAVDIQFRDWKGRILERKTRTFTVPANGTLIERVPLLGTVAGAIYCDLQATGKSSGALAQSTTLYGVFHPQDLKLGAEDGFFGVHSDMSRGWPYWDYLLPGGNMDNFFEQLRFLGITWDRSFGLGQWTNAEQKRGEFKWQDTYVDSALKYGIRVLPILGCNLARNALPQWADSDIPIPDESKQWSRGNEVYPRLDYWCDYVRAMVKHYGDRVNAYEMLNESGWFSEEKYVEFTKATRKVMKEANPAARLVGPGYPSQSLPWDENDKSWIGKVFKLGVYDEFDVITAHFYPPGTRAARCLETFVQPQGSTETTLAKRIGYLRSAYGDKPMWDSEYGLYCFSFVPWMYYPMVNDEYEAVKKYVTPRVHAERWLRWNLMHMAFGLQRSFFHMFGHLSLRYQSTQTLIEANYAPKPILAAMSQAARRLQPVSFKKSAKIGQTTWFYLFDVKGKPVVVYWDFALEGKDSSLTLDGVSEKDIIVEDMMGNPVKPEREKRRLVLPLGTDPVYIMSDRLDGEKLLAALAAGETGGSVKPKPDDAARAGK